MKKASVELEVLPAMRLEAKELQVALHTAFGDAGLGRRRAGAPVCGAVSRFAIQYFLDQPGDALIVNRTGPTRPDLVIESTQPILEEAPTPLAHGRSGDLEAVCDGFVRRSCCAGQHDACALRQRRRHRARPRYRGQLCLFSLSQYQLCLWSTHAHRDISVAKDILKEDHTYVTF